MGKPTKQNLKLKDADKTYQCLTCRVGFKTEAEKSFHMENMHYKYWGGRAKRVVGTPMDEGTQKGQKKKNKKA